MQRKNEHRVKCDIYGRSEHNRPHCGTGKSLTHCNLIESVAQQCEHRAGNVGRKIRLRVIPQDLAAPESEQDLPLENKQRHGRQHAQRQQKVEAVRNDLTGAVHVAPPHADAHQRSAAEADERTDGGNHGHHRRAHTDTGQCRIARACNVADVHAIDHAV